MIPADIKTPVASSILIVDDNPQNLQVLGKILLGSSYKIEFATSGEAAMEWINARLFDLILLDINMPGMNGFEVCSKIRSNPSMDNIPVIFLSADVERESILKGFELGAQDYVTKPFDSRELLLRVRTHLKLKDSLEKLGKFNKLLEEKVIERTEQLRRANEELSVSNTKLLDLDKAKTGFLNLISHEIRTPLNGIMGPLELLKETAYSDIGDLIEILDTSVKRLEKFTLDALLITRLRTRTSILNMERIDLTKIVERVLQEEKEKFEPGQILVKDRAELSGGIIEGELALIKKCIVNILDNAVRFSPGNGTVEICFYTEDKFVVCEIKDHGKGFADGAANTVFDLFTTDDEYKDNCTGIGLPVAKMIVELHGGNIIIGNNPEGGASVKLQFIPVLTSDAF